MECLVMTNDPMFFPNRSSRIFSCKYDLLQFEKAISFESKIADVIADKNFEAGVPVFQEAILFFRQILEHDDLTAHILMLPAFLRKFTSGSVMAYVLTK